MRYTSPLLVEEGLIRRFPSEKGPDRYTLNPNDVRAKVLPFLERALVVGQLEAGMKEDAGLEQWKMLPGSIMADRANNVPKAGGRTPTGKQKHRGGEKPAKKPWLYKRCP